MKFVFSLFLFFFSFSLFSQEATSPNVYQKKKGKIIFHADAGMNVGILAERKDPRLKNSPRIGLNAGIFVDFPIGDQLFLETGIHYTEHGGIFTYNSPYRAGVYYQNEIIKIDYLQFPVLIKAITQKKWFAAGGFNFSTIERFTNKYELKEILYSGNDTTISGSANELVLHKYGTLKYEMGGVFIFGRYFENGFGVSLDYEVTVLGTHRKSASIPHDYNYMVVYPQNYNGFVNSAFGIDLTYTFGKKN
jgi:hypothetical protein